MHPSPVRGRCASPASHSRSSASATRRADPGASSSAPHRARTSRSAALPDDDDDDDGAAARDANPAFDADDAFIDDARDARYDAYAHASPTPADAQSVTHRGDSPMAPTASF